MPDTTNSQITDSVAATNFEVIGQAPAESMAVVYQVMATTVGLTMQNAAANQKAMQQISQAVVGTACKLILELAK